MIRSSPITRDLEGRSRRTEEAVIVAFRRYTLLPLDDCLYALQPTIPHLTRSSLPPLPAAMASAGFPMSRGTSQRRRSSRATRSPTSTSTLPEVRTEQGKLYMFVAIDRTSKFAFVELHEKSTTAVSKGYPLRLIAAVPYKIHTVLTDNGIQFTTPGAGGSAVPLIKEALDIGETVWAHALELTCAKNDIEHRTTKVRHPWTNRQVQRMNRTIKDATVKRYYYERHDQLRQHLTDFVAAYNFARRLKTLKGLTPYEFICKAWADQPQQFIVNPLQLMPVLNI
ncbi:hypothetical protein X756_31175 [Mesorhizobium sp. LSHC412B00]|nr:hypothetical protein X756_31175 [Mesorhizobium sp. LSHC412B00]